MDVTIITVNYKTADFIIGAVESIKTMSKGFTYEIIVVDNASADGSVERICATCPDIKVIASEENLGTSRAYNVAMKEAKGEYIFLLNPDTKLLNNAIFEMWNYIRHHSDTAIVCGNLYDLDENPTHSYLLDRFCLDYIKKTSSIWHIAYMKGSRNKLKKQFNVTGKAIEVGYACAAAMIMRTSDIQKVGMFDESIFMYGEEAAISEKLRKIGKKTVSIPEPRIMHFEGGSFRDRELKKHSFSESRYKRFIKGNYEALEIIDGPGAGKEYYKLLLKREKEYQPIYRILGQNEKMKDSRVKMATLEQELKAL